LRQTGPRRQSGDGEADSGPDGEADGEIGDGQASMAGA
jgi:hypothetical protein